MISNIISFILGLIVGITIFYIYIEFQPTLIKI